MKLTALVLAMAGFAAAQDLPGQSECAVPCLKDAIPKTGCKVEDVPCICKAENMAKLMNDVAPCILKCKPEDIAKAKSAASAACAKVSSSSSMAASSSGSMSMTGSHASSKTHAASGTASISASDSDDDEPTATATNARASKTSTSSPSSSSGAAAGGPVTGALAAVLAAVMFL